MPTHNDDEDDNNEARIVPPLGTTTSDFSSVVGNLEKDFVPSDSPIKATFDGLINDKDLLANAREFYLERDGRIFFTDKEVVYAV